MDNYENATDLNETIPMYFGNVSMRDDYIFDRTDVKVIFITLYSIVFVCCFFGNLVVILVVTFSRQLRSITNFFLANLAVADLCVGIFCVYQTLTNYLMPSWPLGNFLCKTYMFVNALSYTASIMILVVVCTERYLAIVHPIKCRSMRTRGRLRAIVGIVWILAAIYAAPKFIYVETIVHKLNTGNIDIMCIANIKKHNRNVLAAVNLILLYLFPLILMCCLYTKIAVGLWKSGAAFGRPGLVARTRNGRVQHVHASSKNALRARRGVIRMLIAVVIMFAVCNLPQQARIVWLHWDPNYDSGSDFSTIFTLSTFLISYMNSCLNPLLYAFLSRNFRKGMRELLICNNRGPGRGLRMGCTGGDKAHTENGHNTHVPHSSVVRLSSAHDSPSTTHTMTRQNTIGKPS
ncbi:trissin receptor isoform X2 [Venturia canescens]|nr:trissin receptor-like isoform X2 [Venturia canescens]XP_043268486.1 trissin receptor-like isoform X2 [Venturia canescens]XP_043268494.1 trissin receptor-like isoform X2 [Venturia canescens]XP_043268502.1 trissin receptor-like isoform X2 [Venturia canescens]XP_043268512.1 trissin receptor-like isoform X2 [Venturia canescens]XP_043268521.1 trissin receptor-like isoform X2 [Venturia canescens]XP_043268530.1 trissin receptor-like isoform X2 [Venturia canescens]XP_043268531.1 trissin receptor-